jgi:hypothetical protein
MEEEKIDLKFLSENNYKIKRCYYELTVENKTNQDIKVNPIGEQIFKGSELIVEDIIRKEQVPLTLLGNHIKTSIGIFVARSLTTIKPGEKGIIRFKLNELFDLSRSSEYVLKGKIPVYVGKAILVDIGELKFKILEDDMDEKK